MGGLLLIWVIIAIGALAVDIITSAFLFIWFTLGAIAAIIANLLGYSTVIQIISFLFVSGIFMAIGYPLIKTTIKKTVSKTLTTEQGYIGRDLTVDEDVIDKAIIKIDGIYWTIKNEGTSIKKGDRITIIGIEGNKLLVKKV